MMYTAYVYSIKPCMPHSLVPCKLPNDCAICERFVCSRCELVKPWSQGSADDTPALCDECAVIVQSGWV